MPNFSGRMSVRQSSVVSDTSNDEQNEQLLWEDDNIFTNEEDCYLADNGNAHLEDIGITDYYKPSRQYIPGIGLKRYNQALHHLIPIRKSKKSKGTLEIDNAGLWSFLSMQWLTKYIYKSYKNGLTLEDIPRPSPYDTCDYNVQRLENLWQEELRRKGPQQASLLLVTWKFMSTRVLVSVSIFCLSIIFGFISTFFFMRYLLEYVEDENNDRSIWVGLMYAFLLTLMICFKTALNALTWTLSYRTAIRLKTACIGMLYRKVLRLSNVGDNSVGQLINIFANDGQRVFDLVVMGPMVIGGPLTLILGTICILHLLSPWALFGMLSVFLFYPIQFGLSRLIGIYRRRTINVTDERISIMNEIWHCIKLIKINTWEELFTTKIEDVHKKELDNVRKVSYGASFASSFSATVPYIAAIITFLSHVAAGYPLLPSQAFAVLSFFTMLLRAALLFTRDGFKSVIDFSITLQRFKAYPVWDFVTGQIRVSITYVQYGLSNFVELSNSCKRFQKVLLMNETKVPLSKPLDKSQAVCIANGWFTLDIETLENEKLNIDSKKLSNVAHENETMELTVNSESEIILTDINFFAPKGKLIGICGQVGSGKSSLLNAILGQIPMIRGKLCREGTCAYATQIPWLMNATLKENIIFGEKFNKKRYFWSVYCSCLNDDIVALPGGDETEIGDRGINLSGGQKQRIALARAIYSNRDIYLLDDPFSSVDAVVGQQIFERCIKTALKNKTVILVTHQIPFLKQCDDIVLMKGGTVLERGCHDELLGFGSEYALMVKTFEQSSASNVISESEVKSDNAKCKDVMKNGNIVSKINTFNAPEKAGSGSLKLQTIISYISASGGLFVFTLLVILILVNIGSTVFSSWWLAIWLGKQSSKSKFIISDDNNNETVSLNETVYNNIFVNVLNNETDSTTFESDSTNFESNTTNFESDSLYLNDNSNFLLIYSLNILVILLLNFIRGVAFTQFTQKASKTFHNRLILKLFEYPMVFFETTPVGRLLNIFSKDFEEIQVRLPIFLESWFQQFWFCTFSLLLISIVYPWFIIPLIFMGVIYFTISKIFRVAICNLRRLDNVTRSPIFSTVSTMVHGLDTIHAFGKEQAFMNKFLSCFDLNTTCLFMCSIAERWLSVRIDAISACTICITALLVVFLHNQVPASLAGLAITYAVSISTMFQFIVRLTPEVETKLISLERINNFIEEKTIITNKKSSQSKIYPAKGYINFQNVFLRYRENFPFSLNDVSFSIKLGEKIGIVGRTGSGKTSLLTALLRLVELNDGVIMIDNIDITILDLNTLRNRFSVIPQDPVIFSGTVRENLDPAGICRDADIWSILEKTKLKSKIESLEHKLDTKIVFGGEILSVGERQLLCLSRAFLKKASIILMDEATSGIDRETELQVWKTVEEELSHCTILCIAHRVDTIFTCDRILVMDNARVAEFDEPNKLLENPNSLFTQMVNSAKNSN